MKKSLLSIAIMAALPLNVMAANISGAMYTAPSAANNDHPAPTTQAAAPFGRIDIDTADQDHIASTAYVKGAYNSAIAAVNKMDSNKQGKLMNMESTPHVISNDVVSSATVDTVGGVLNGADGSVLVAAEFISGETGTDADNTLITTGAVLNLINSAASTIKGEAVLDIMDSILSEEALVVAVYTTWDDDTAKAPVDLSSIGDFE